MVDTALPELLPRTRQATTDLESLARFVGELGLPSIDYLTVDLDGLELDVLQAIPWDRVRPAVIECEFRGGAAVPGISWREIGGFLQGQDYAVYVSEWHPFVEDQERQDWRRVVPFNDNLDVHPAAWGKLFAFAEDPGWPLVRRAFHLQIERPARPAAPAATAAQVVAAPGAGTLSESPAAAPGVSVEAAVDAGVDPAVPAVGAAGGRKAWLKQRSPSAYRLLRMGWRAARGLWRRRRGTIPVAVVLAAWILLGFVPAMAPFSLHVWGSAALSGVTIVLLYAIYRVNETTRALRRTLARLRDSQSADQKKVTEAQAKIGRLERALADGASTNAELLRKVGRLEESVAEGKTVALKGRRRG